MGNQPERGALSDAEQEVLKALWEQGPGTVRQVRESLAGRGRPWAYTTVLTLLQRLHAKGWVQSDTGGAAHIFRAAASRDELLRDHLQSLADRYCEGESTPLVLALVQGQKLAPDEVVRLRRLLDELEGGDGTAPKPGRTGR